jgi:hypothetical protein
MFSKLSNGYKVSSPGIAIVLVCFFLPWVLQSCGSAPAQEYSGWELAIGDPAAGDGYNGNPLIFLAPVAAIIVGAMAFRAMGRGVISIWDGIVPAGLGGLVLIFLYSQFGGPVAEGSTRQILYGLWGTVIGWLLILVGGVLNLLGANKAPNKT